jgi:hypothetical protein
VNNRTLFEIILLVKHDILKRHPGEGHTLSNLKPKTVIAKIQKYTVEAQTLLLQGFIEDFEANFQDCCKSPNPVVFGLISGESARTVTREWLLNRLKDVELVFKQENFFKEQKVYLEILQRGPG